MAVVDLYSKRQKRLRGEVPDVYQYDAMPRELRVQVIYILQDAYGEYFYYDPNFGIVEEYEYWHEGDPYDCSPSPSIVKRYELIHETLCREYGVFTLGESTASTKAIVSVIDFFLETQETDKAIDVLEISFRHLM